MKKPTTRHHPKLGDGRPAELGGKAWYPNSHDGFTGPHEVKIIGIKLDGHVEMEFDDGETSWTDADNLYARKPSVTAQTEQR